MVQSKRHHQHSSCCPLCDERAGPDKPSSIAYFPRLRPLLLFRLCSWSCTMLWDCWFDKLPACTHGSPSATVVERGYASILNRMNSWTLQKHASIDYFTTYLSSSFSPFTFLGVASVDRASCPRIRRADCSFIPKVLPLIRIMLFGLSL